MNELAIAEEVKSYNCFFIPSWRTFQEGVKNYMLLVLQLPLSPFFCCFLFSPFFFSFFLVALHGMWDLSFLTRDQICAPCIGSVESEPLDYQESPISLYPSYLANFFHPVKQHVKPRLLGCY